VERKKEGGTGAGEVEDRPAGRQQARQQTGSAAQGGRSVQVREVNVRILRSLTATTAEHLAHPWVR